MAQYQKGDLILDEAKVGTKTAEDWTSQGFKLYTPPASVASPAAPVAPKSPIQPVVTSSQLSQPVNQAVINQAQRAGDIYVSNKQTLAEYSKQGLKESDIRRDGDKIYIKSDSQFAQNMAPKEAVDYNLQQASSEQSGAASGNDWKSEFNKLYDQLIGFKTDNSKEMADVAGAQTKASDARLATEKARQGVKSLNLEMFDKVNELQNQVIPMNEVRKQIAQYDQDQKLDVYMATQGYNDAQIYQALAEGNLAEAQRINQSVMNDRYEIMTLQLDKMKMENAIDEQSYDRMMKQASYDLDIQNKYGYTPINDLQSAITQYGQSRLWQDPVSKSWYVKPEVSAEIINSLMTQFPDAGILMTDDIATVNQKIKKSALYQEKIGEADKPITQQVGDTLLQYDSATGQWVNVYSDGKIEPPEIIDVNGVDYQVNPDGTLSEPKVPSADSSVKTQKADEVISAIDSLLNDKEGISDAVGPISNKLPTLEGSTADFEARFKTLIAKVAIENLSLLKGPMSDKDIAFIKEQAAALSLSMSEKGFVEELNKLKTKFMDIKNKASQTTGTGIKDKSYYKNLYPQASDQEIDALIKKYQSNPNSVGGDTNKASSLLKATTTPDGTKVGQCGRFVNEHTGLSLGDSYASKMAKMDKSIKKPEPGMVFVMPYQDTGHTGFIVGIQGNNAIVKDSNWSKDGKVKTHLIPLNKMTGFRKVNKYA